MRKYNSLLTVIGTAALLVFMTGSAMAQHNEGVDPVRHGLRFVDLDGDGYNDNAPDADGDGIPNRLDPDYVRPANAPGQVRGRGYVDLDGDGFNDNASDIDGDGIPNGRDADFTRPGDGSGRQLGRSGNEIRTRNMTANERGARNGNLIRTRDRVQDGTGTGSGSTRNGAGVRGR